GVDACPNRTSAATAAEKTHQVRGCCARRFIYGILHRAYRRLYGRGGGKAQRKTLPLGGAGRLAGWLLVPGEQQGLKRFVFTEPHMGTTFRIVLYAADEETARRAAKAAFARAAELDAILSDYRPNSELMQLCKKAGGEPVPVSEDLFKVL